MLLADHFIHSPQLAATKPKVQRGAIAVYEALRDDILWLRLAPGSAIDELALAARFDISRTPVREALMLLAAEHLLVFLPNRTSIVPPLSLHNLGQYMDMYLLLSRSVVRGAAANIRADHAEPLESALAAVIAGLTSEPAEPALRADLALRHLIGDIAGNWFQGKFYRQILDMGIRSRILHFFPNSRPADLSALQQAWAQVIAAIQSGDAAAADDLMTAMILNEGEVILRSHRPSMGHEMPLS